MDGAEGAVLDVELGAGGEGAGGDGGQDDGQGQGEGGQQRQLTPEQQQAKADREYKAWLKGLRDADPKTHGRFARQAQDDRGRLLELSRLEPKGIDGVREKFAILDSVTYEDPERGVLTGTEAVAALQDQVREMGEVDSLLAAGDPRALEALGDDFNEGLAKLTPAILDRVRAADPEAYAAAILPHFVQALAQSDLIGNYNALVDTLNEAMPQWLPEDKKAAWIADKFRRVTELASGMGGWLKAQMDAAKGDGKANVPRGTKAGNREQGTGNRTDKAAQEQEQAATREATQHYSANITPKLNQHAEQKFNELFRPYAKRLHLDNAARADLAKAFTQGVTTKAMARLPGNKPNAYEQQMTRYWRQRTPAADPVVNYAKVEFDKHAPTIFQELINRRYKPFLAGPRAGAGNGAGNGVRPGQQAENGVKRTPVSPGVTVVSVLPPRSEIDFKGTPLDWMHAAPDGSKKYRLVNGKTILYRPQR